MSCCYIFIFFTCYETKIMKRLIRFLQEEVENVQLWVFLAAVGALIFYILFSGSKPKPTGLWLRARDAKTGMPVNKYWMPEWDGAVWTGDTIEEKHVFKESRWIVVERIDTVEY